jgi:hypothetical protein
MDVIKKFNNFLVQTTQDSRGYVVCIAWSPSALCEPDGSLTFDYYVYVRNKVLDDAQKEAWRLFEEKQHGKTHSREAA